jgi:hypothetical protein
MQKACTKHAQSIQKPHILASRQMKVITQTALLFQTKRSAQVFLEEFLDNARHIEARCHSVRNLRRLVAVHCLPREHSFDLRMSMSGHKLCFVDCRHDRLVPCCVVLEGHIQVATVCHRSKFLQMDKGAVLIFLSVIAVCNCEIRRYKHSADCRVDGSHYRKHVSLFPNSIS